MVWGKRRQPEPIIMVDTVPGRSGLPARAHHEKQKNPERENRKKRKKGQSKKTATLGPAAEFSLRKHTSCAMTTADIEKAK